MTDLVQDISVNIPVPVAFGLPVVVALLLYWIGGRIRFRGKATPGELASYSCGENLPGGKLQIDEGMFFVFCAYFLIFDILAFIIATSLGQPGLVAALYAAIALCAISLLFPLRSMG